MGMISSEVSSRFAVARLVRSRIDPVTGNLRVDGLIDPQSEERLARRALLAQEVFSEYGPLNAPQLPLNGEDMSRLAMTGDFGLAVASFAFSLERNDWDIQKHPDFDEYVAGLLSLPTLRLPYGAVRDPDKLCCWYGAHPLRGLRANGVWHPPVH
jgi:hypothetical protein